MFNICSSKNNALEKGEIGRYLEVCRAVYQGLPCPDTKSLRQADCNFEYWHQLHDKLTCIHAEIQEKSKSINKSFGIFNEDTLKHAPGGNIAHDIEGYVNQSYSYVFNMPNHLYSIVRIPVNLLIPPYVALV